MRAAKLIRKTSETNIAIYLKIEGKGRYDIKTPVGFFTHMLESFAKHGLFDIKLNAKGDLEVDQHHTIEDTGIALGQAFRKALGDKKGINRAGYFIFPMDESVAAIAIDISSRPYLRFNAEFRRRDCGGLDTDLIEDFFYGVSIGLGANIAIKATGRIDHHKIESIFKAFGKAMKTACSKDKRAAKELPSTKGLL